MPGAASWWTYRIISSWSSLCASTTGPWRNAVLVEILRGNHLCEATHSAKESVWCAHPLTKKTWIRSSLLISVASHQVSNAVRILSCFMVLHQPAGCMQQGASGRQKSREHCWRTSRRDLRGGDLDLLLCCFLPPAFPPITSLTMNAVGMAKPAAHQYFFMLASAKRINLPEFGGVERRGWSCYKLFLAILVLFLNEFINLMSSIILIIVVDSFPWVKWSRVLISA